MKIQAIKETAPALEFWSRLPVTAYTGPVTAQGPSISGACGGSKRLGRQQCRVTVRGTVQCVGPLVSLDIWS